MCYRHLSGAAGIDKRPFTDQPSNFDFALISQFLRKRYTSQNTLVTNKIISAYNRTVFSYRNIDEGQHTDCLQLSVADFSSSPTTNPPISNAGTSSDRNRRISFFHSPEAGNKFLNCKFAAIIGVINMGGWWCEDFTDAWGFGGTVSLGLIVTIISEFSRPTRIHPICI